MITIDKINPIGTEGLNHPLHAAVLAATQAHIKLNTASRKKNPITSAKGLRSMFLGFLVRNEEISNLISPQKPTTNTAITKISTVENVKSNVPILFCICLTKKNINNKKGKYKRKSRKQ
jgi:hypothetical protein